MEKDTSQECRLAQTCPKFDHPLEHALKSNKKDKKRNSQNHLSYTCRSRRLAAKDHHRLKTSNLILVGPKPVMVFTMFDAHYPKRLPAQVKGQSKSSQVEQHCQQSLQHRPDLDPTAPITSNIPPREASREPRDWGETRQHGDRYALTKNVPSPRSPKIGPQI